jgi:phage-related protein
MVLGERMVPKTVIWLGDSKDVLINFPDKVREDFGWNLWQLQKGNVPSNAVLCHRLHPEFLS